MHVGSVTLRQTDKVTTREACTSKNGYKDLLMGDIKMKIREKKDWDNVPKDMGELKNKQTF